MHLLDFFLICFQINLLTSYTLSMVAFFIIRLSPATSVRDRKWVSIHLRFDTLPTFAKDRLKTTEMITVGEGGEVFRYQAYLYTHTHTHMLIRKHLHGADGGLGANCKKHEGETGIFKSVQ
jgi:hypothetical protein